MLESRWQVGCGKLAENKGTFAVRCLSMSHMSGYCSYLPAANKELMVDLVVGLPRGGGLDQPGRSYHNG